MGPPQPAKEKAQPAKEKPAVEVHSQRRRKHQVEGNARAVARLAELIQSESAAPQRPKPEPRESEPVVAFDREALARLAERAQNQDANDDENLAGQSGQTVGLEQPHVESSALLGSALSSMNPILTAASLQPLNPLEIAHLASQPVSFDGGALSLLAGTQPLQQLVPLEIGQPPPPAPVHGAAGAEITAVSRFPDWATQAAAATGKTPEEVMQLLTAPKEAPPAPRSEAPATVQSSAPAAQLDEAAEKQKAEKTAAAAAAVLARAKAAVTVQVQEKAPTAAASASRADRPLRGGPNCMGPSRGIKKKTDDTAAATSGAAVAPAANGPVKVKEPISARARPRQLTLPMPIASSSASSGLSVLPAAPAPAPNSLEAIREQMLKDIMAASSKSRGGRSRSRRRDDGGGGSRRLDDRHRRRDDSREPRSSLRSADRRQRRSSRTPRRR